MEKVQPVEYTLETWKLKLPVAVRGLEEGCRPLLDLDVCAEEIAVGVQEKGAVPDVQDVLEPVVVVEVWSEALVRFWKVPVIPATVIVSPTVRPLHERLSAPPCPAVEVAVLAATEDVSANAIVAAPPIRRAITTMDAIVPIFIGSPSEARTMNLHS